MKIHRRIFRFEHTNVENMGEDEMGPTESNEVDTLECWDTHTHRDKQRDRVRDWQNENAIAAINNNRTRRKKKKKKRMHQNTLNDSTVCRNESDHPITRA